MAMLGLAPAAAASGAIPALNPMETPRHVGSALSFQNPFSDTFESQQPSPMEWAKGRLDALRWQRKHGIGGGHGKLYDSASIESRKATSRAIKDILQAEYRNRLDMEAAEREVQTIMIREAMPEFLKRWL